MESKSFSGFDALAGYVSALPAPFKDGRIDEDAFADFCAWQIEQGIAGLVVNGTTGEAPTLDRDEQRRLVRIALEVADGRVPVIAGAGANATTHAVDLARLAEAAGADALLVVTPYYNRPSQEGLFHHFAAVHDATRLPIMLYDVPSRTGCTLAIETIRRLAAMPRIAGLKDATGDLDRPSQLRRLLGEQFRLMSGDDATALAYMERGGNGCISVVSNVVPRLCARLYAAHARGDAGVAQIIARGLEPLTHALFAESNPVPVKYALSLMDRMSEDVRLPLWPASEATRHVVAEAMAQFGFVLPARGAPLSAAAETTAASP
jgi:4-hydroxy-tetrahydrodipicolinate synthase